MDSRRLYCRTPEKWFGGDFSVNDSDSGPEVRVTGRKSELRTKKSELQPGRPPESGPNHLEKGPERGLGASTENPPLKAFLNPPNFLVYFCCVLLVGALSYFLGPSFPNFWYDFDLKSTHWMILDLLARFGVKIGSNSGQNQVKQGVGVCVGFAGGGWNPPNSK